MNLTPEQLEKLSPDHPLFKVIERLGLIEQKMTAQDPEIGTHLKAIHTELRQYEELAHLLTPEQIGVFMKGLQKYAAVSLVMDAPKKSGKSKKIGVDDII